MLNFIIIIFRFFCAIKCFCSYNPYAKLSIQIQTNNRKNKNLFPIFYLILMNIINTQHHNKFASYNKFLYWANSRNIQKNIVHLLKNKNFLHLLIHREINGLMKLWVFVPVIHQGGILNSVKIAPYIVRYSGFMRVINIGKELDLRKQSDVDECRYTYIHIECMNLP
jgi:flagella basal body P-ring formation protein FlgA